MGGDYERGMLIKTSEEEEEEDEEQSHEEGCCASCPECPWLKGCAIGILVLAAAFGIFMGLMVGVQGISDAFDHAAGGAAADMCGLPVGYSSRLNGLLQNGHQLFTIKSQPDPKQWQEQLAGCYGIYANDIVSSKTKALQCVASCQDKNISTSTPLCVFDAIISQPLRVCMKAQFAVTVRNILSDTAMMILSLLYMVASVAAAASTYKKTNVRVRDTQWQEVVIKYEGWFDNPPASMMCPSCFGEMKASRVAKIDLSMRLTFMLLDRYSDVNSIMVYFRNGQPVFGLLMLLAIVVNGDPLQQKGLHSWKESWDLKQPTLALIDNAIDEGFYEGSIGAIIPLAALARGIQGLDAFWLVVSAASSLNSVYAAVQALEMQEALKLYRGEVGEESHIEPDYLTQLALAKDLSRQGLKGWRILAILLLLATGPSGTGFLFGLSFVFLVLANFVAHGFALKFRSFFPMAVPKLSVLTIDGEAGPQHGRTLFYFRVALVLASFIFKTAAAGFVASENLGGVILMVVIQFAAQLLVLVMLLASTCPLSETYLCCLCHYLCCWCCLPKLPGVKEAKEFAESLKDKTWNEAEALKAVGAARLQPVA